MDALRLKNVRCFQDTGWVPIRPLTILVGKNSSGKSTFARWFPLMRQSVETLAVGPLLWYGNLVDFGDGRSVLREGASEVGFGWVSNGWNIEVALSQDCSFIEVCDVYLDSKSFVRMVFTSDRLVSIEFENNKISLSIPLLKDKKIFPVVEYDFFGGKNILEEMILQFLRKILHTDDIFLRNKIKQIVGIKKEKLKNLLFEEGDHWIGWNKGIQELSEDDCSYLYRLEIMLSVLRGLPYSNAIIDNFVKSMGYIGPYRQMPGRYTRFQDLAVDMIDPTGMNLPMVLRALSTDELQRLSLWLQTHLGFGIDIISEGSHTQVNIIELKGKKINVVDTGFGLSQVLPVAVQLWRITMGMGRRPIKTLVMEQPELHLHPELQAKLGTMFAGVAAINTHPLDPFKLIVETHSESLINAVGQAIAGGKIEPEKVSVVLFEKNEETGISSIRVTEFDQDGVLKDWPIGFFAA